MRTSRLLLSLGIFCIAQLGLTQTYTHQHIDQLIAKSEKDSIARIERLAALKFHRLINDYRKQNGLNEITWNETIWIATINHNTWMEQAGNLSHHQKNNTANFTGASPGDRLKFAENGVSNLGWTGENALYNFSAYGQSIEQIAESIATRSFKQWKNSPGHNKNMLSQRHGSHAVAFKIAADQVWGTDLFSAANSDYKPSEGVYTAAKIKRKTPKRFSTFKTKRMLQDELFERLSVDLELKPRNWVNNDSEAKQSAYRLARKRFESTKAGVVYTAVKMRIEKKLFGLVKRKIETYSVVLQRNVNEISPEEISDQLKELVKENQFITTKTKLNQVVVVKKRRDNVYITLVSISSNAYKGA